MTYHSDLLSNDSSLDEEDEYFSDEDNINSLDENKVRLSPEGERAEENNSLVENNEEREIINMLDDIREVRVFGIVLPRGVDLTLPEKTEDSLSEPVLIEFLICRQNIINTITFPCNHAIMCNSCARSYGQVQNICPFCRTPLESIHKLYLNYQYPKRGIKRRRSAMF